MDTFTWIPDYGAGKDDNPELTISKFGDGYAVRSPKGLNHVQTSWPLTFTQTPTTINAIEAILKKQGGYKTFIWNPPDGSTHTLWVCEKWNKTLSNYGYSSLTAEFIQVFK